MDSGDKSGSLLILLVEDNPGDVRFVKEMLREAGGHHMTLEQVATLAQAIGFLNSAHADAALIDLGLPDSRGLATYHAIRGTAHDPMAIIVLTGNQDDEVGIEAIRAGADDFLVKGQISGPLLVRSIKYAIERRIVKETLREKNEEVKSTSQQLWQLGKLATMGELAASIAHELNNPLATVSLRVETLMLGLSEDDPRRHALEIIDREIDRMAKLVANLLEFSRRNETQVSTLDVREELDNSLELIQYHLRKREITVERDYPSTLPMIQADRQHLRQLFLNLFTNAGDAMPGGGLLTIRVRSHATLKIDVADTGEGIASENLSKVLEPFFTTKPRTRGTGLGLPICQRIAREHGGNLTIASTVGEGTTVCVELPLQSGVNGAMFEKDG